MNRAVDPASAPPLTADTSLGETLTYERRRPAPAAGHLAGNVLGRFELVELLGQGGFGAVYRAHDSVLDRQVALKIPRTGSDDPQQLKRFLAEAKSAARLRHPNIVAVFESGLAEGHVFIATEYVAGEPLAKRIARERPDFSTAARWTAELADALQYAHSHGIVHRDVKPQNIMLDASGRPQLMDFGLAKRLDEDSSLTTEGSLLGTPAYMSPEQARGENSRVGPASDQYSLGVVLYELLTGKRPFDGPPHKVIAAAATEEPPAPTTIRRDISPDLEAVCLKAMSKEIANRYTSAGDFAEDLRRWLRHDETTARPIGRLERLDRWRRRNPTIARLIAAVALSLLVGTAISLYFAIVASLRASEAIFAQGEANSKSILAQKNEQAAKKNADLATERADRLEWQLYISNVNRALVELERNNWGNAVRLLAACPEKLRGWEWRYVNGLCHLEISSIPGLQLPRTVRYTHGREYCIAFSRDGNSIAWQGADGQLRLWDPLTGQPKLAFAGYDGTVLSVAFSKNGRMLAAGCNDFLVRVWDVATGELLQAMPIVDQPQDVDSQGIDCVAFIRDDAAIFAATQKEYAIWETSKWTRQNFRQLRSPEFNYSTALTPDEKEFVVSTDKGNVIFFDRATGRQTRKVATGGDLAVHTTFSPDGRLAASSTRQGVAVWDFASGKVLQKFAGTFGQRITFSPDGRRLLATEGPTASICDLNTERELVIFRGHSDTVSSAVFSPHGDIVATAGQDGDLKIWDARRDRSGVIFKHPNAVVRGAWTPDGRGIVTIYNSEVLLWHFGQTQPNRRIALTRSVWYPVAWHPSGQEFAYAGKNGQVIFCDTASYQETDRLFEPGELVRGLAYSGSGNQLIVAFKDKLVILDTKSRQPIASHPLAYDRYGFAASDRDAKHIALGGDGQCVLLDAQTGRTIVEAKLPGGRTTHPPPVCFSPDGKHLLHGDGSDIVVRSATTGTEVRRLAGHTVVVNDLKFTPDGTRIASVADDGAIKIWHPTTGDEILSIRSANYVWLEFSPDGNRLLTGGYDRTARIWEATPVSSTNRPGTPLE
jgi:eukaryotic-like serine/threonine-protein kinase